METEADNCLETGADNCLETGTDGNFNLDEIQQFLAGGDDGFVDPVFVDHEDSQNAADLDQLVFETEKDNQEEIINIFWMLKNILNFCLVLLTIFKSLTSTRNLFCLIWCN